MTIFLGVIGVVIPLLLVCSAPALRPFSIAFLKRVRAYAAGLFKRRRK